MRNSNEWLKHLEGAIPDEAKQNKISLYTIALEGWRRGLELKFYSVADDKNKHQLSYSLAYNGREHHFQGSKGDLISDRAQRICDDKSLTYEALDAKHIPIPKGRTFNNDKTDEEIISYADEIGLPVVLKPTNGSGGKGVIVNIQTVEELVNALKYVRGQLGYNKIVVEQFVSGEEYRIYVLNDKVIAAVHRMPANVVGDGKSTLAELIEKKNENRKSVPHLYNRPIKKDKHFYLTLKKEKLSLKTVPQKNERIFLKRVSNISTGGDPIDVTDNLPEDIKKIAVNAAKSIPGLPHCGLDMIVDKERNVAVVIELNTRPGLGSHLFPIEGKSRDVPKAIIDLYFPETIGLKVKESKKYFYLKDIDNILKNNYAKEVIVAPHNYDELKVRKININVEEIPQKIKVNVTSVLTRGNVIGELIFEHNEMKIVIAHRDKKILDKVEEEIKYELRHVENLTYTLQHLDVSYKLPNELTIKDHTKQVSESSYYSMVVLKRNLEKLERNIKEMVKSIGYRKMLK
ncbi:ATP-grasp domain-containing protein [Salipaludibacillus sp. LMS25]|uniref:ATP-grasp domain-containing protein n=1 Tax=Salipaludibacillus sp. LMS25 TaxID=2924031 RepID=UPI0020CFFA39|nr:ATP-grasp domain-containing protein [Salipaludibacillus sp. LMS25]UTR16211.1 ATP-grasp domain-containing protein [Salipaludibacillus sp. LMS25]